MAIISLENAVAGLLPPRDHRGVRENYPIHYQLTAAAIAGVIGFALSHLLTAPVGSGLRIQASTPFKWALVCGCATFLLARTADARDAYFQQRLLRWKGPGFCFRCGYDLRASPDRCPECGTVDTTGQGSIGPGSRGLGGDERGSGEMDRD